VARLSLLKRRQNPADQKLIVRLNLELVQMIEALQCPCPSRYSIEHAKGDRQQLERLWRKRRSRKKLNAIEDTTLAHINARHTAFVSGPEMRGRAWLAELKEKERIAFGPPLTCREQALLIGLSTLYPPEKTDCDPEFLADWSAFSTVDADDDGYPLEYQRAKAPPLADAGPSSSAESAPSEAVEAAEESMSSVRLQARAETADAGEADAAENLDAAEQLDPDLARSDAQHAPSAVEPDC
jgi:hypothetical protein